MLKSLLFSVLLLGSFASYAKSPAETIEKIETERDVRCEFKYASSSYCFNYTCYSWRNYQCTPNDVSQENFKVRLRTRTFMGGEPTVTNITYIKN